MNNSQRLAPLLHRAIATVDQNISKDLERHNTPPAEVEKETGCNNGRGNQEERVTFRFRSVDKTRYESDEKTKRLTTHCARIE